MLREYLDRFIIAYLDDILIYTIGTLEQHIAYVSKVLEKLYKRNLRLIVKKCRFYKKEVTFLRFIIRTKGVKINPEKIRLI